MKAFVRVVIAAFTIFTAWSATAAERATPAQAQALLNKAVEKVQKDGPDAAFAAFDNPAGGFKIHELYVFVFDMNGKYMASGANPKLVGTDARNLKDAEGTYLVRKMIALAKSKGRGSVRYLWLNRVDNKVEKKRSFIQRVGKYIVGVGYYLG